MSSELPVLSACIGPLANMISIAALVNKWRQDKDSNYVNDTPVIVILNAISLTMGCIANLSLVLNFSQRLNYKALQLISIICFFVGSMLLLTAILLAKSRYFTTDQDYGYTESEGFWFAVLTLILYFGCSTTCFLNFLGFLLKKYPPEYNLRLSERGLIIYTFILAIWFSWGAAMFSKLLHISYGNAMYYCTVSLLTIGLGDITPDTDSTKAMSLVYSLSGVIILGLIIAMIRGMIIKSSNPVFFWNIVEIERKKAYDKVISKKMKLTPEQSFEMIRAIRKKARLHQSHINLITTILIFVAFWLIGAMIFHFTEGWRYFDAVYFCFLCLITIGYGDYAPKSTAGRPVFIVWSLGAVPLMTALISSVGDSLYTIATTGISLKITNTIFTPRRLVNNIENQLDDDPSVEDLDNETTRSVDEILDEASNTNSEKQRQKKPSSAVLMKHLKSLIIESKDSPQKVYSYEEWATILELLEIEDDVFSNELFWISDKSPLAYPINEPNYMLFLLFSQLESRVDEESELIANLRSLH